MTKADSKPERRVYWGAPRRVGSVPWLLLGASLVSLLALAAAPSRANAQAPARQLTVERIYSAPSLSGDILRGATWSPDGKLLSYLGRDPQSEEQEVWAVAAATGRRSVLVDAAHLRQILLPPASRGQTTGLGRLAPTRYLWAPNSQALLFISAEELFWYDLPSKTSKQLVAAPRLPASGAAQTVDATIDDAKISPDGTRVSFLRNHDIWMVTVATGETQQLTRGGTDDVRDGELDWVYPEELHLDTAYWWSPDSSRIAYLQLDERPVTRYPLVDYLSPHGDTTEEAYPVAGSSNPIARLGIVDVDAGETRWIDAGADQTVLLARVTWLRDSRHVAIQRLNRVQNRLDLLVADTADGKAHTILEERDPYWINLSDDLYFLSDGQRFLWSSERSGFRHLYLYNLEGKQLAQLTRGDWEVEGVARVDEGGGAVYFTSTEKSPLERQLYRVPLSGGEPAQITREPGTHEIEMAPDAAHFLDTYSTALHPPKQVLENAAGGAVATLAENNVPELAEYHLQPVEFLHVPGAVGEPLDAEMIKPEGFDPSRKYPVLVYVYGGPEFQVVQDEWDYSTLLWNELMAQKGFIIFAVDNRGAAGRGHRFETPIYHHFGQAELADQLAAVKWLAAQPYVDAAHVGIWGWSYGGYMACLAMLRGGGVFKAGFAGAPVTDWRYYDTIYTERYMGTPQENPEGYRDSSPVNFAAGLAGKLLIAHATGDDNVHFANTVELAEKLVEAQKYAEIQLYAGRGHGISDAPARIHIFDRMTQFFIDNLEK